MLQKKNKSLPADTVGPRTVRVQLRSDKAPASICGGGGDEGCLPANAFPFTPQLDPNVDKTAGTHNRIFFHFYSLAISPGNQGHVPVQLNLDLSVAKLLKRIGLFSH